MTDTSPRPIRKIRLLDQHTVNKIAAGEVVERPASVVKELVENAIDAGAGSIRIDLSATGPAITAIRVTDDGTGIAAEDVPLAFAPHATSKIAEIRDLDTIRTLGFRGEALASIASVSKVTMITRPRDSELAPGTRYVIAGGTVLEEARIGAPGGTSILVEDLFYNTPARKKFQRSLKTELAHVHGLLEGLVLAHPKVAFRLTYNGSDQVVTDRGSSPLDTIARIYGADLVRDLVPVSKKDLYATITGYVARPSVARKDTGRIFIAINGRYVSSPPISNAIKAGYGTLLPKDRFPVAFLALDLDPALVDVNVHPTKKLVRLSKEPEITRIVTDAVHRALAGRDLIPDIRPETVPQTLPVEAPRPVPAPSPAPAAQPVQYRHEPLPAMQVSEPTHAGTAATDRQLRQTELPAPEPAPEENAVPPLTVVGQFGGIYILATTPSGELIVIDQHAAHERILYEQAGQKDRGETRVQELIAPVLLHRTPRESQVLSSLIPELAKEGFVIEEFGSNTFLVRAVPVVLGKLEDSSLLDDIVSDVTSPDRSQRVDNRERITRIVACRGAIKAGTVCTPEQCQRVADQLRLTRQPFTCPHGRPTMIRFSRGDLDALFRRS